jgi:hypothetical protein
VGQFESMPRKLRDARTIGWPKLPSARKLNSVICLGQQANVGTVGVVIGI